MPGEGRGDEPVAVSPDEQRGQAQAGEPVPETPPTVGFVQVDLAQAGKEGNAPGAAGEHPEELVGAGVVPGRRQPVGVGEQHPDPLDDHVVRGCRHRQEAEFGPQQPHDRHPLAQTAKRRSRGEQNQRSAAALGGQPGLDRYAPAHGVAQQHGGLDRQGVEELQEPGGEPGRAVAATRAPRRPEARQVRGHDVVVRGQIPQQGEQGGVGGAEAVQQHDRRCVARAGFEVRGGDAPGRDHPGPGPVDRAADPVHVVVEQAVHDQGERKVATGAEPVPEEHVRAGLAALDDRRQSGYIAGHQRRRAVGRAGPIGEPAVGQRQGRHLVRPRVQDDLGLAAAEQRPVHSRPKAAAQGVSQPPGRLTRPHEPRRRRHEGSAHRRSVARPQHAGSSEVTEPGQASEPCERGVPGRPREVTSPRPNSAT